MELEEFKKTLAKAREDGKLVLGTDKSIKALKQGKVKLVAFAKNSPFIEDVQYYANFAGVDMFPFPDDGMALGELCKRPFNISTLAVVK